MFCFFVCSQKHHIGIWCMHIHVCTVLKYKFYCLSDFTLKASVPYNDVMFLFLAVNESENYSFEKNKRTALKHMTIFLSFCIFSSWCNWHYFGHACRWNVNYQGGLSDESLDL